MAATAILLGGASTATASAASTGSAALAAPCDARAFQNNSSAWGYFTGTYNLKKNPAAECANVKQFGSMTKFYVWCYVTNYYGNDWVYGRVAGTETKGWMYSGNVTYEGGTLKRC
ncbi:hypothetical protein [Streptomyces microflavus]|uniref:hypothetical protein n=1 Tax=Streptomyces microflavus TaxID=1919 RepID=UPI00365C9591